MTTRYGADELSRPVTQGEFRALAEQFVRGGQFPAIVRDQHRSFRPEVVTKLPVRPPDGYEVYLEVDAAGAYSGPHTWHLRYHAGDASASKWRPVGAQVPLFFEVPTQENTTSTGFTDLATVGPVVITPLAGDYFVLVNCRLTTAGGAGYAEAGLSVAGAAATGILINGPTASHETTTARLVRVLGAPAGTALKLQYKTSAFTGFFMHRAIAVAPIRLGP